MPVGPTTYVNGGYSNWDNYAVQPASNNLGLSDLLYKGLTFGLIFLAFKEMISLGRNIWSLKTQVWDKVKGRSLDPQVEELIYKSIDQGALKLAAWMKQE